MQTPEDHIAELLTDSPADRPSRVAARDAEIRREERDNVACELETDAMIGFGPDGSDRLTIIARLIRSRGEIQAARASAPAGKAAGERE